MNDMNPEERFWHAAVMTVVARAARAADLLELARNPRTPQDARERYLAELPGAFDLAKETRLPSRLPAAVEEIACTST